MQVQVTSSASMLYQRRSRRDWLCVPTGRRTPRSCRGRPSISSRRRFQNACERPNHVSRSATATWRPSDAALPQNVSFMASCETLRGRGRSLWRTGEESAEEVVLVLCVVRRTFTRGRNPRRNGRAARAGWFLSRSRWSGEAGADRALSCARGAVQLKASSGRGRAAIVWASGTSSSRSPVRSGSRRATCVGVDWSAARHSAAVAVADPRRPPRAAARRRVQRIVEPRSRSSRGRVRQVEAADRPARSRARARQGTRTRDRVLALVLAQAPTLSSVPACLFLPVSLLIASLKRLSQMRLCSRPRARPRCYRAPARRAAAC